MKVIVTGGAGFIGSNLVRLLIWHGHEVLNIDKLTYAGNLESLTDIEGLPNYRFFHADVCDASAMQAAFSDFQPDGVMHLAAESHVDRSIDGPGAFINTNILGTYTLLEASRKHLATCKIPPQAFRFIHISTDEVYGSLGDAGEFTETTAYNPSSPYSASKAASDHLARAWHHTYGLPVIVTNGGNNYGPYQFPEKLVPLVLLKALRGESIPVYGTGKNVRDWIHVEDHVEALVEVLKAGTPGETYNIGGNDEIRNIDLVIQLCSILDEVRPRSDGRPYAEQITFVADRPGHDLRYALNSSKIRELLGWVPRWDHESGFRMTVEWYLNHETWWRNILNGSYQLDRIGSIE